MLESLKYVLTPFACDTLAQTCWLHRDSWAIFANGSNCNTRISYLYSASVTILGYFQQWFPLGWTTIRSLHTSNTILQHYPSNLSFESWVAFLTLLSHDVHQSVSCDRSPEVSAIVRGIFTTLANKKLSYGIVVHSKGIVHGDLTAVRGCLHHLDVMMTSGMAEQHSNRFELQRPCCWPWDPHYVLWALGYFKHQKQCSVGCSGDLQVAGEQRVDDSCKATEWCLFLWVHHFSGMSYS